MMRNSFLKYYLRLTVFSKSKKTKTKPKRIKNTLGKLLIFFPQGLSQRIFILTAILTLLGLLFIADVSAPEAISVFQDKFYYTKQQLIWGVGGILVMFIVSNIKISIWEKYSTHIFSVGLVLMAIVLVPGLGIKVSGARRWIDLGFLSFQPSEFLKLGLVIYYAKLASKSKNISSYIVPMGIIAILIMFQPDLGTALVITMTGLSQILIAGVPIASLIYVSVVSFITAVFFVFSSEYRRNRLISFIDPFSDVQGNSYHIQQVIFALASGGLFGLGLGQSKQKYLFLPEASTDSIFAIIGEEMGFIGGVGIVILYMILLLNMFAVVKNADDTYSKVLAVGITSWLAIQTLMNLGSIVSAIPFTGVPLPFLSYGGSSLMSLLIATGIMIKIAKSKQ